MKAGVSHKDITPPVRTRLADHTRYSTGVHDPLFVKTLVLDDGENAVAIVCLDLCVADVEFCDELRERIRKRAGIEHALINFSHTHSAPLFGIDFTAGDKEPHEIKWEERINQLIPETVEEAYRNRAPVSLHVGRAPAQVGFNRRHVGEYGVVTMAVNKAGAVVPWVNVLHVRTEDGQSLAVLFEHAAHPVIVHQASTLTGADYPVFAVQRIKEELGEDVTAIFAQGCGANINGYPLRGGWEKAEAAGRKLGDAVLEAMRDTTKIKADKLNLRSTHVTLPTRELATMEQWKEACTRLKILDLHAYSTRQEQLARIRDAIERGEQPEVALEVNAIMLGSEWCLVAMQHEMFCEYELWIDENAPFGHTMVFGYTNGNKTYIATDRDVALGEKGGYEAGSFPSLWAYPVRSLNTSFAVGVEGTIKAGIASLWPVEGVLQDSVSSLRL